MSLAPRTVPALIAAGVAGVLLTACSSSGSATATVPQGQVASTTQAAPPPSTPASPTAGATPSATPTASASPSPSAKVTPAPSGAITLAPGVTVTPAVKKTSTAFASPARTVFCTINTEDTVGCFVVKRTWVTDQPEAASCLDKPTGRRLVITAGAAHLLCVGTAPNEPAYPSLPVGQSVQVGTIVCGSTPLAVVCTDRRTGHGFTAARKAYTLF